MCSRRVIEMWLVVLLMLAAMASGFTDCPDHCQCSESRIECSGIHTSILGLAEPNYKNITELTIRDLNDYNATYNYQLISRLLCEEHKFIIPAQLRALNLSGNSLEVEPRCFYNHSLEVLDLGHNKLRRLNSSIDIDTLKWLNLASNEIYDIRPVAFVKLVNLEHLDLSNNMLYSLEAFLSPLKSLQRLFLAGNKLEHIGTTWFQSLGKLVELDVSRNKLTFVMSEPLQPLVSLSVLKLSENPLIKRDLSLLLSTGRRLEIVDASRIGLIRVPAALTHSIRILRLAGNQLTSIDSGDLDSYPLLRELDLSDNRLVNVEEDALGRLDNLEELKLSGNLLPAIPKSLPGSLKILDLSQNALSSLRANDLQNLRSLIELNLSGNVIVEIEAGFFRQLTALRRLDISDNPFVKLPSDALNGPAELTILRMAGLTSLKTEENQNQDTAFPILTPENLVELDLSRSPSLASQLLADNAALSACKSLKELNLAYTSIDSIRSDLGYVLPQLNKLNLLGNDWNCSDDQLWLGKYIRHHDQPETLSARCKAPSKYEGLLLHEIHVSETSGTPVSPSTEKPIVSTISEQMDEELITNTEAPEAELITEFVSTTTTDIPTTIVQTETTTMEPSTTMIPTTIESETKKPIATGSMDLSNNVTDTESKLYERCETKGKQNKRLDSKKSKLTDKGKKEPRSIPNTTSPTRVDEEEGMTTIASTTTTTDVPTTEIPTTNVPTTVHVDTTTQAETTTTTTTSSPSTTEKLMLAKLKATTPVVTIDFTSDRSQKEIKDDVPVTRQQQPQKPPQERVFSEFSRSKLLFANEDEHQQEVSGIAEELSSQANESGARTSESFASGAHPGMLVLLGAALVAAAAMTIVLSRRATANRRERQYQRHENIEVHALTPTMTTELW